MKKYPMIITILMLSSFLIMFTQCEDPVDPNPINESLPEITAIDASASTILQATSLEVSVEAADALSYEWIADGGTFADPTASTTNWTAPAVESPTRIKLECYVKNESGQRKASVTVSVVAKLLPEGVSAYWSFEDGLSEEAGDISPEGGEGVSITSDAKVGDGAALFEGEEFDIASALFYAGANTPMGPDDDFTFTLWVKTEDEDLGFMFGSSFEGGYVEGAKSIYVSEGAAVFDVSWIDGGGNEELPINDGEWHHIAVVKLGMEVTIYIDGAEAFFMEFEEWSDDEGTVTTIGAAAEEEGSDWPGTFQGILDDIRFYPEALDEETIISIMEE